MRKGLIFKAASSLMLIGAVGVVSVSGANASDAVERAKSAMDTFNSQVSERSSANDGVKGSESLASQIGHSGGVPSGFGKILNQSGKTANSAKSVTWVDNSPMPYYSVTNDVPYWRTSDGSRRVLSKLSRRCGPESKAHRRYISDVLQSWGKDGQVQSMRHTAICVSNN